MEIEKKFLPIGTVVVLKGADKKVMITGFCVRGNETGEKIYDYTGCIYPEGVLNSSQNLIFDHEQISQVFFKGYVSEEETTFKTKLNAYLEKMNSVESLDNNSSSNDSNNGNGTSQNMDEPVSSFIFED